MKIKVYRLRLLDDVMRTPDNIRDLLFSSCGKAEDYMKANGLKDGWWAIDEVEVL